jgi:hypothetical protein
MAGIVVNNPTPPDVNPAPPGEHDAVVAVCLPLGVGMELGKTMLPFWKAARRSALTRCGNDSRLVCREGGWQIFPPEGQE